MAAVVVVAMILVAITNSDKTAGAGVKNLDPVARSRTITGTAIRVPPHRRTSTDTAAGSHHTPVRQDLEEVFRRRRHLRTTSMVGAHRASMVAAAITTVQAKATRHPADSTIVAGGMATGKYLGVIVEQ